MPSTAYDFHLHISGKSYEVDWDYLEKELKERRNIFSNLRSEPIEIIGRK